MSQAEKYAIILNVIAEALAKKDDEISFKNWKIQDLEARLKSAEEKLSKLTEESV